MNSSVSVQFFFLWFAGSIHPTTRLLVAKKALSLTVTLKHIYSYIYLSQSVNKQKVDFISLQLFFFTEIVN